MCHFIVSCHVKTHAVNVCVEFQVFLSCVLFDDGLPCVSGPPPPGHGCLVDFHPAYKPERCHQ